MRIDHPATVFAAALVLLGFALIPRRLPRLFAVLGWCLLWWDANLALTWHDLTGAVIVALALVTVFTHRRKIHKGRGNHRAANGDK
ncbi:hypothetical protein ACPZ19_48310 [Amycolatopsis lurida]